MDWRQSHELCLYEMRVRLLVLDLAIHAVRPGGYPNSKSAALVMPTRLTYRRIAEGHILLA
jgi:hypothetical protein